MVEQTRNLENRYKLLLTSIGLLLILITCVYSGYQYFQMKKQEFSRINEIIRNQSSTMEQSIKSMREQVHELSLVLKDLFRFNGVLFINT